MNVTYTDSGRLQGIEVGERWLLILGGVTRQGNRQARRSAAKALESGIDVVWFDGFEETYESSSMRVTLEVDEPRANLVVVGFSDAEANTLAGRLRMGRWLRANPLGRLIWKLVLRRIGSMLRPRAGWTAIRSDIRTLSGHRAPEAIVYGDDYAITSAWYASRVWKSVSVATGWPKKGEA